MARPVTYRILSDAPGPELADAYRSTPAVERPSCMVLLGSDDSNYYNGRQANGLYSARFGRTTPLLTHRIADFLRYETAMGRTTLIYSEYACDLDRVVRESLETTPAPDLPRDYDPPIVVHSTPLDRFRSIVSAGAILPSATLQRTGNRTRLIGFENLGEPPDYIEFVHFSEIGSATGEIIVLSHHDGRINTDFDAPYTPGARIYLDFKLLRSDGRIRRDGLHMAKAYGPVELGRYAVDTLTATDLPQRDSEWTPRLFAEAADTEFLARRH